MFGARRVKGLCPYSSSPGRRPSGSLIQRSHCFGNTSPKLNVIPPTTTFRRERCFSATYAASSRRAYLRGPVGLFRGSGWKAPLRLGSPQIIHRRTVGFVRGRGRKTPVALGPPPDPPPPHRWVAPARRAQERREAARRRRPLGAAAPVGPGRGAAHHEGHLHPAPARAPDRLVHDRR